MHLVGHSLGAHVVGFLGKKIQELGYGKVPRITGKIIRKKSNYYKGKGYWG